MPNATLYRTAVMHRRMFPVRYRFAYQLYNLLLDIDELDRLPLASRLISHNRFNLFSFHDRDHGPRDGTPLRPWAESLLARFDIDLQGGHIRLFCLPRVLGYAFNPLSIWYCSHRDGSLRAILCEVHNTFGESHTYVLHRDGTALTSPVRLQHVKCFHVSPFMSMQKDYRFRIAEPGRNISVVVNAWHDGKLELCATQTGSACPLDSRHLLQCFVGLPLMTLKVTGMIHWQALKIWLKGALLYKKPDPPTQEFS